MTQNVIEMKEITNKQELGILMAGGKIEKEERDV